MDSDHFFKEKEKTLSLDRLSHSELIISPLKLLYVCEITVCVDPVNSGSVRFAIYNMILY